MADPERDALVVFQATQGCDLVVSVSGSRYVPGPAAMRNRLRPKGKARETIRTAVAFRLPTIFNAIFR